MPFVLGAPAALLLLLAPLLVALAERARFGADHRGPRALRALLLSLLALAAAQPLVELPAPPGPTLHLVDRSPSIDPAALAAARAEIADSAEGLLWFDDQPRLARLPGETDPITLPAPSAARHTDLAAALTAAPGLLAPGGRLVIWTDGGAPLDPALQAALSGLPVTLRPLPATDPTRLVDLTLDRPTAAPGQTLTATLTVDGGTAGYTGPLTLEDDGAIAFSVDLTLAPHARQTLTAPISLPATAPAGPRRLQAHLGEDALKALVTIAAPPAVAFVGAENGDLAGLIALAAAEGMATTRLLPGALPARLAADPPDVIVLADVPTRSDAGVPALPATAIASLRAFVEGGGGLVVLGGPHAYDQGGYADSPVDALLPLKSVPAGKAREVPLSLLVVMDTSGSMARPAAGGFSGSSIGAELSGGKPAGSKIELADEAVAQSALLLRPIDRFGVIGVDTQIHWRLPLQEAARPRALAAQVRKIGAGGGGIYMVSALSAARAALQAEPSPLRHIFFFADAADAGEEWDKAGLGAASIAAQIAAEGGHLSVLALGDAGSKDAPRLQALATAGAGRFRLAASPAGLAALFVEETERVRAPNLAEDAPFRALPRGWHPALRDINWDKAPLLAGRNKVEARPKARSLLTDPAGAPILAAWTRGAGEVMAWSTDAGARWAAAWTRWPGYGPLWTQTLRHLAAADPAGPRLDLRPTPAGLLATLTLRDAEGRSDLDADPTLRLEVEGVARPLALRGTVPGEFEALLPLAEGVEGRLTVEGLPVALSVAVIGPPNAERAEVPATFTLLGSPPAAATARARLWPGLLSLALLLLPLDVLLRRPLRRRTADPGQAAPR